MATEVETLVVALEARINQFERNFQRASGTATRTYGELTSGSSRATRQMEQDFDRSSSAIGQALAGLSTRIGDFSRAFVTGFIGGGALAAVSQLPRAIREATASLAEMKAQASVAGLPVEDFQRLAYVATTAKIPVDAMTDALKEMQLRGDEFAVTGSGSAAEAFARLGYNAATLKDKLKDPIALFDEVIERLKLLDQAAQIRVLDEVFGGSGGERMMALLSDGARRVADIAREADTLGVVLQGELVDRAAELDIRFNQISETIAARMKTALVETGSVLASIADQIGGIEQKLGELGNADFFKWMNKNILGITPEDAAKAQLQFGLGQGGTRVPRRDEWLPDNPGTEITVTPPATQKTQAMPLPAGAARKQLELDAVRQAEAIAAVIEQLKFEAEQLKRNELQQEIATAQRRAGVDAASAEGRTIADLVTANHQLAAARDAATEAQERATKAAAESMQTVRDVSQEALGGFLHDLKDGVTATEALANALSRLSDRILDLALDSLFDSLFKPTSAAGGSGGGAGGIAAAIFGAVTRSPTDTGPTPGSPDAYAYGGGSSADVAARFLREREGYRSSAYWDVNAYRVGYGSDTTTDPLTGAVSAVGAGTSITRAMAEADLARRIALQQSSIVNQVGPDAWNRLAPGAQGALTSVGYNYGRLPGGVATAVQSGDPAGIAEAIQSLAGDNGGVNAGRRELEATMVRESQALETFGKATTGATGSVGQFGQGLASAMQGTGAGGGSGGGLFDWFGSLFKPAAPAAGTPAYYSSVGRLFHEGGVVGVHGQPFIANADLFRGAPRFHSGMGLAPDEMPAILKRGEVVIPDYAVAAMRNTATVAGGGGARGEFERGGITVNIANHAGADVSARQTIGPGGRREVEIIVEEKLNRYRRNGLSADVAKEVRRGQQRGVIR